MCGKVIEPSRFAGSLFRKSIVRWETDPLDPGTLVGRKSNSEGDPLVKKLSPKSKVVLPEWDNNERRK
jgi:hypothetical protein